MNRKIKYISVFVSVCLIMMSAILAYSHITSSKTARVSYLYPAMDIASLSKESDLIIKGTVEEVLPSNFYRVTKYAIGEEAARQMHEVSRETKEAFVVLQSEDHVQEFLNENVGWVYTDKAVRIDKYLKNDLGEQNVRVREYDGEYNGRKTIVEDEVPLKQGDKVILFLTKAQEGSYAVTGGPQGKFFVTGDSAQSANGLNISIADLEDQIGAVI